MATNVLGTINVTRCVLQFMRPQGSGVIANFGSLASWEGGLAFGYYVRRYPHQSFCLHSYRSKISGFVYAAYPHRVKSTTKWAVSGFTESLNKECRPLGIAAVIIEQGYFRTEVCS